MALILLQDRASGSLRYQDRVRPSRESSCAVGFHVLRRLVIVGTLLGRYSSLMPDLSRLLDAAAAGDRKAAADLLPLVYDELRNLAAARMAAEAPGHSLSPTALVHEAYLRLIGDQRFDGRGHFFAAAAEAMRRILVDHARSRKAAKRGGGRQVTVDLDRLADPNTDEEILAVHDALHRLAVVEPRVAKLVTLRYFGGMTVPEAAQALDIAPRTADAWWAYARAWLAADLSQG